MKKIVIFIALVAVMISAGCEGDPPVGTQPSVVATTAVTSTTSPPPSSTPTSPNVPSAPALPEYQPGSIILQDQEDDDYDFQRKYRITYYRVWGEYMALLNDEERVDAGNWFQQESEQTKYGELQEEMMLVSFIKRYNIKREEFDLATAEFEAYWGSKGYTNWEEYEVPNGDIIYTFDNEIINYYYRYE